MSNSIVILANTIADPLPLTPTSVNSILTVPEQPSIIGCDKTVVLSNSTVAALISQQSANAYDLTDTQRIDQGIFDGVVGASLNQLTLPGQFLKPGSAQFIQSKLLAGMDPKYAIGDNLFTGTMGIKNQEQLRNSNEAQSYAITSSLSDASTRLTNAGVITGRESDSEIAGLLFAAAISGPESIRQFFNDTGEILTGIGDRIRGAAQGINTTANNLKQLLSGGNYASKLADKFTRGVEGAIASAAAIFNGLKSRLSSAITGIRSAISGVANFLKGIIEKSYGSLVPNKPNNLAGNPSTSENPSETSKIIQNFDNANQKVLEAEELYFAARKKSRDAPTADNLKAVETAQQSLLNARRQAGLSSVAFLKNIGNFINPQRILNSSTPTLTTTNTSGINAVGGASMFASDVDRDADSNPAAKIIDILDSGAKIISGSTTSISDTINSATAAGTAGLTLVEQTAGLVSSVQTAVSTTLESISTFNPAAILGNITQTVLGAVGRIQAALSSFGSGISTSFTAILATGTVTSPSITTVTAELLGDSRIPKLNYDSTTFTSDPDSTIQTQGLVLSQIEDLRFEQTKLEIERDKLYTELDPANSTSADIQSISRIDSQIANIASKIAAKEVQFVATLGGSNVS